VNVSRIPPKSRSGQKFHGKKPRPWASAGINPS
jgi:hypothetical protein